MRGTAAYALWCENVSNEALPLHRLVSHLASPEREDELVVALSRRAVTTERKARDEELNERVVLNESAGASVLEDCGGVSDAERERGGRTVLAVRAAVGEDVERERVLVR